MAVSAAAVAADYPGPAGLKWGASPDEVRKVLGAKFEFLKDNVAGDKGVTHELSYKGTFGGFAADLVLAELFQEKLFGLVVMLQKADSRPAWRRWQEVVNAMTTRYGKPKTIENAPPKSAGESAGGAGKPTALLLAMGGGADDFDAKIQDGSAKSPTAVWQFDHRVSIKVLVKVANPDAKGDRDLNVFWTFFDGVAYDAWSKAVVDERGGHDF